MGLSGIERAHHIIRDGGGVKGGGGASYGFVSFRASHTVNSDDERSTFVIDSRWSSGH